MQKKTAIFLLFLCMFLLGCNNNKDENININTNNDTSIKVYDTSNTSIEWEKEHYYVNGNMIKSALIGSESSGFRYIDSNGYIVTDMWIDNGDGTKSYISGEGYLVTSCIIDDGKGNCYYVDNKGHTAIDKVVDHKDKKYYANDRGHLQLLDTENPYDIKADVYLNSADDNPEDFDYGGVVVEDYASNTNRTNVANDTVDNNAADNKVVDNPTSSGGNIYEKMANYTATKDEVYKEMLNFYKECFTKGATWFNESAFAERLAKLALCKYMVNKYKKEGKDYLSYLKDVELYIREFEQVFNTLTSSVDGIVSMNQNSHKADIDNNRMIKSFFDNFLEDFNNLAKEYKKSIR